MSHTTSSDVTATRGEEARTEADVVVVGAGPAGATAAAHLARRGLDVVVVEKSVFPREKVCGDGLTPRAVRQLVRLGVDTSEDAGWLRNRGLRIIGGGHRIELDWPDLTDFPPYGLVRPRADFDALLAEHAVAAGARLVQGTPVAEPIVDERTDRVVGVRSRDGREFRAPVVVAADGTSARTALARGLERREDRPMGVAVRAYYDSPRTNDEYLESWLELWAGEPQRSDLLPGYGWVFGMGDGTVNIGLGILNTSSAFGRTDYRELMRRWLDHTPLEWGFREENRRCPIQGAALPMAFNRVPHHDRGLLLVGDSGGMVNPFNGEGIAYAMESAEYAADAVADAHARGVSTPAGDRALDGYPARLRAELGGYFRLGTTFVRVIGHPTVMGLATKYGLPRRALMGFTLKLLANLTDAQRGDATDHVIGALRRLAPSA